MQIDTFKSIISTFADPGSEIIFDSQRMMFSINGDVVDAGITAKYGDIYVDEGAGDIPASRWIVERLAKLHLLSSRILEQIPAPPNFVSPAADFLPTIETNPNEQVSSVSDALDEMLKNLDSQSPLETSVLYITSDAGEGKTSLINAAARKQALRFTEGSSDWLLVPIILGGRHFLRFDDITVGALQNKYRFPFLYYNSFLALVRMGVIIPAFDGFEEMFVENSSGEALSAMGILVGSLNSTGTVVVAARKAYFEFENLRSQEKLYDTISNYSVGFSKLELNRWEETQFLQYCKNRNLDHAEDIYQRVAERLGKDHSLLTRPVLVRRLVDIAQQSSSLEKFIEKIHSSGSDFFSVFVRSIIEREANEKWIDRSGDIGATLITVDEHCELLALIAINMWESRIEYLKQDHLDVVAEYFCESKRLSAQQSQQVRDRISGHALLIASSDINFAVEFDHDEFRQYFLGDGLANVVLPLNKSAASETLSILRRGILPDNSQLEFIRAARRQSIEKVIEISRFISSISKLDGQASYTKENCGNLTLKLLSEIDSNGLELVDMVFGIDAIRDCKLKNISFKNCYFSQSSYETTEIKSCQFDECNFGQLRVYPSTKIDGNSFIHCTFDSIRVEDTGLEIWEPGAIKTYLDKQNSTSSNGEFVESIDVEMMSMDNELVNVEKLLRYFMRSTHISESVIKIKLGDRGQTFIDSTLPDLIETHVIEEIENRGSGQQRRFKLGRPLQALNTHLASAQGSYERFIAGFK
ncbi:pentapeptide repeat-containing protein [Lonsdalea quercina]|uniref:pentapeptide repeat-containing protein n=1 Tax=Lonsdalea quercina TaxID=71657 RepID=UPI00047BD4FC|nr:pentapeptide repeat-containing protein [Lonsdalea quercina]